MLSYKLPLQHVFYSTYKTISEKPYFDHEFGVPTYRNVFFNKLDDLYVASYNGHRFAEWHPNGDIHLLFTRNHSAAVTARMNFFPGISFYSVNKKRKAKGEQYNVVRIVHSGKSEQLTVYERLIVRIERNDIYLIPDQPPAALQKDNKKYTAFNKQLKTLKSCLVAQVRFGAYVNVEYKELTRALIGPHWPTRKELYHMAYIKTLEWIKSEDPDLLLPLAVIAFYLSSSCWYGMNPNTQKAAVMALCRNVQVAYLRNECVNS
jgi:hypothetical protein